MATLGNNSQYNMPLSGLVEDGWSTETEATATCFCGTVQLSFVRRGIALPLLALTLHSLLKAPVC